MIGGHEGMLTGMTVRYFPIVLLFALSLSGTAVAETIYRWVDSTGQAHYTDVPREGAEPVELKPASTFSPSATAEARAASRADSESDNDSGYESLVISSPTEEQTIWNTGGVITVTVRPQPALKPGHGIILYYDDQPLQDQPMRTTNVQLSEVYRGTHSLRADVVGPSGQVLISSPTVTFFYKQSALGGQAQR